MMNTAVNKFSASKYLLSFQRCLILLLLVSSTRYSDGAERTHEETACDGDEMHMLCSGTKEIKVRETRYGRQDDRICIVDSAKMTNTHCYLSDAEEIVSNKCNGKTACSFTVGPSTFPNDPCPGTDKYLKAIWECVVSVAKCPGRLNSLTLQERFVTTRDENAAWLRDPVQHTNKIYYMGWSKYESSQLYEYTTGAKLVASQPITFYHLPDRVDGTGFVVWDGSVYYNKERSRTVVKYDMSQRRMTSSADLPNANYHGTSPYAIEMATDIDMAVDENGLWVIYATEANNGNIVISKLQSNTLEILDTWTTSYEKLSALNAFIACGVLYVVNYDTLRIDYMYNTTSDTEKVLSIPIPGLNDSTSAIEYNHKDQMLYVWDNRVATAFKIDFQEIIPPTTTSTTTTTSRLPITTTTTTTMGTSKTTTTIAPGPIPSRRPNPAPPKFCPETEASGLVWPGTTFSHIAILDCPGGGVGRAIWICGGNITHPSWTTPQPDLTQCSSLWIKELAEEIEAGSETISDLSVKMTKLLNEKQSQMTSWDIVVVVKILEDLLVKSSSDLKSASTITDSILKSSSELLHPAIMHLWKGLGTSLRTETAVSLANVLEEAAFFLAKDMLLGSGDSPSTTLSTSNSVAWSSAYATLAIRIEPVSKSATNQQQAADSGNSQVVTLNSGHGDSVVIDDIAVMQALRAQAGDKMAIVHLSFKSLGGYLVDSSGFGGINYPVNSQVITLSVKSMQVDGTWSASSDSLKLKKPVILKIHHNIPSYRHHVCAYWNDTNESSSIGSWSRSGCSLVSGNQTHSTCKCDHLTDFVILSSDDVFPLMGAEETDGVSDKNSSERLLYVNVIRGGMIISVVFLIMAAITLLRYSTSLDLNTIRKNLVLSSLASEIIFLVGIDQVSHYALCVSVAAILHYGVVCTFVWAALEPYHHLVWLTDLHEQNHRWKYYYLVGYGVPVIVVGLSAAIHHQGYVNESVCWMQTNGSFIWSFIVPSSLAIIVCVLLVAVLMYKLSREKTNLAEPVLVKNIRADAVCTCLLMFLLCAMWGSGFMWMSAIQFQVTSWFFSILCAVHGIASFYLYCILPPEVCFLRCCLATCWKNKNDPSFAYQSSTSRVQLVSGSSRRTTLRGDGSTAFSDHHYSGQSGATLIPASEVRRVGLAKAATMMNGSEISPLVGPRPSATLSHDLVSNIRPRDARESSFSSLDDTDPKVPTSGYQRQSSTTTWNDYVHNDSRSCLGTACNRSDHMVPYSSNRCQVHGSQCGHSYEQPTPSYCACTTSTGYSCCYDHLHDELRNGGKGRFCSKCRAQSMGPPRSVASYKASSTHLYETLGSFAKISEDVQSSEHDTFMLQSCSTAPTMHCHRYEDVAPDSTCMMVLEQPEVCEHDRRFRSADQRGDLINDSNCVSTSSHCHNHSYCSCSKQGRQKVSPGPSKGECVYYTTRNGRSSDPLSTATDQGYDTDPQQLNQLTCRNSHCDNEGAQILPPGIKLHPHRTNMDAAHNRAVPMETTHHHHHHDTSRSAGSDCGSENDREVEIIINASQRVPEVHPESFASTACSSTMHSYNDNTLNAIDTAKGGTISASGSVTSWSAFPGSIPRASHPAYGQNKSERKNKTTMNPQEILAQARQNHRSSVESLSNVSTDDRSVEGAHPAGYTGYTLPGTSQAGTKARIDLRTGGISMITNL